MQGMTNTDVLENDLLVTQMFEMNFNKNSDEMGEEPLENTKYHNNFESDEERELRDIDNYDSFDDFVVNVQVPLEHKTKKHNTKLSNKACNDLKQICCQKKGKRCTLNNMRSEIMTEFCMNQFTELLLAEMVNITGIINSGKDTIILHAIPNPSFSHKLPKECAVKIYKRTLPEFKQWEKFIKDDNYFKNKFGKQFTKEVIQKKAEKEKKILLKLQKAGVNCPRVVTLKKGVLVTSFIGKNQKSAPTLKDAVLTKTEWESAIRQVIIAMEYMYEAKLIHIGLSEDSILWHNKTCYFINVTNCVEPRSLHAFNLLYRNCSYILNFFSKKIGHMSDSADFMFRSIVGGSFNNKLFLARQYLKLINKKINQ